LLLLVCTMRGESPAAPGASSVRGASLGVEPMTASAAELRRAGSAAKRDGGGSTWLLEEFVYRVEPGGATTVRHRSIIAIETVAGAEEWRSVISTWAPWFEDTPAIDARVLDREGKFHRFDPRTVELSPTSGWNSPTAGDRRQFRARLPAIAPGAIAETVLTTRERAPMFAAGSVHGHAFGKQTQHIAVSRVVIDSPTGMRLALHEDLRGLVARRVETAAGRTRRIYEASSLAPFPREYDVPADVSIQPSVSFSTGTSWTRVAADYDALVRRQSAAGPLPADVRISRGASRRQTIARAVDLMHRSLAFTGLGMEERELAPLTPAEVWQRRYGDSKDLATFLVALLARARIEAQVALVDTGPDRELTADLPGLGEVDHAIVYVPGEKVWIDPSNAFARPGQLPLQVDGRLALIAASSTRGPVRLPSSRAADNYLVERRTVTLPESGFGTIGEVSRFGGLLELGMRAAFRTGGPVELQKHLETRIASQYYAARLGRHRATQSEDLSTPFTVEVTAERAGGASARAQDATVWIDLRPLFQYLPLDLRQPRHMGDAGRARGQHAHPRMLIPHVVEWNHTVQVPEGFEADTLPAREQTFGPATYSVRFEKKGDKVRGHVRFTLSRGRIAPAELDALEKGVKSILADHQLRLPFKHQVSGMLEQGDLIGALTRAKAMADRAPGDAARLTRFSYVLSKAGLTAEAVDVARRAIQNAPSEPWVHSQLSWAHRHDGVGRIDVPGFDRPSAIVAMERAAELGAGDGFHHHKLGFLRSFGDDGSYLGGDPKRAAEALVRAVELGDSGFEDLLLHLLMRLGDTATLDRMAQEIESEHRWAFRLAAARDEAALRLALQQIPASEREKEISRYAFACLQISHYERLRRFIRLTGKPLPLTAAQRDTVERMRKVPADPKTAADLLARWVADSFVADGKRWLSGDALKARDVRTLRGWIPWSLMAPAPVAGLKPTRQLIADVVRASVDVRSVERAGPVELFEASATGGSGSARFYVSYGEKSGNRPRILMIADRPHLLAPAVLRAADAGRLDEARRILDMAVVERSAAKSLDLAGSQLSRFWSRGKGGGLRRIRLAAAGLLVELDPDRSLAVLAQECSRGKDLADACRMARGAALARQGKHREAEEAVKGLVVDPADTFVVAKARGLVAKRAWSDLERLSEGKLPEDAKPSVEGALASSWIARGQSARARAIADSIRASHAGKSLAWRNSVAWIYLFTGGDLKPLIADLEAAIASSRGQSWAALHTLAACYARVGRHREALTTIQRTVGARGRVQPIDHVVLGRIAAAAGLTATARRSYDVVISDPDAGKEPDSTAALARLWLAELPGR
jgi:transglutaminase-like putative cysteine protease